MALSLFGRRNNGCSIFDPFSFDPLWDSDGFPSMSIIWDVSPARSFAPEISAVARTQVDWKETPDAHIFKVDLPGLSREEIKVQVHDGRVLQISGHRSKEETEKTDKWHRVERAEGSFMRQFRLPESAKVEEVKAAVENGVLTVTVPKSPPPQREMKTIDVTG